MKILPAIQSTVIPSNPLPLEDWRLYLKVRNVKKVEMVKHLTVRINQVLNQSLV